MSTHGRGRGGGPWAGGRIFYNLQIDNLQIEHLQIEHLQIDTGTGNKNIQIDNRYIENLQITIIS